MAGTVPQAVRDAVQRLKAKHKGVKPFMAKLSPSSGQRVVADETRDFWRSLIVALKAAPGAEDRLARQIAANGGTDVLAVLAQVDSRGVHGAAEYCWAWLSAVPAASAGSTVAATDVLARHLALEKAYKAVVDAYDDATAEPPYTPEKGRRLERACEALRRAGSSLVAGSADEQAQIKSCAAAADHWWAAYRAAVPWYGRSDAGLVEGQLKVLLSDASMKKVLYTLPPRGWYDLAVLRKQAEDTFKDLGGAGGIISNWTAGMRKDTRAKCYDRTTFFGKYSTAIDPFTKRRSNLPMGEPAANPMNTNDWNMQAADAGIAHFWTAEHHAVEFVWQGGFRPGAGSPPAPRFVIDVWKGGEYLLCTYEKWRSAHPE